MEMRWPALWALTAHQAHHHQPLATQAHSATFSHPPSVLVVHQDLFATKGRLILHLALLDRFVLGRRRVGPRHHALPAHLEMQQGFPTKNNAYHVFLDNIASSRGS